MEIQKNIPLKKYTNFKIGGPAKYFCAVGNKEDLIEAISFAKREKLPFFVLGGGSNLLVSDEGFNGLVIKIQNMSLRDISRRETKYVPTGHLPQGDKIMQVGAGVPLAKLISIAANAGFSGLEWAAGIPRATIGGAIRGNAGAFETEIKDIVASVEAVDAETLKIRNFENKDCRFSYRSSIFKENPNLIVLSCELNLRKENKEKIKEKVKEILNYRKEKHPAQPSAGSIFKNLKDVRARDLIEKAGLKGKIIGGAQISEHHANFIINIGGAKAKDVWELIDFAKKEVKDKFGIKIEEEIYILGDF